MSGGNVYPRGGFLQPTVPYKLHAATTQPFGPAPVLGEHTGAIEWGPATPTGIPANAYLVWQRPGTVHDFDGDGKPEWASSSQQFYAVYDGPDMANVHWKGKLPTCPVLRPGRPVRSVRRLPVVV